MKVILQTDIEKLGKLGDVVDVKPGYARNYLIPKNLALEATPSNLKLFEQKKKKLQEKLDAIRFKYQEMARRLEELSLVIKVRVGEGDKLYGSVTSSNIAEELEKQGFNIDRKKIELERPIRSLGEYSIPIKLFHDIKPEVKLNVVRYEEEHQQQ